MRFEFATANRILFGAGTLAEVPAAAAALGRRVLVVTGRDASRADGLRKALRAQGLSEETFSIVGEPKLEDVAAGARRIREEKFDVVIALGGGSAIDGAKAMGGLATNDGDLEDYLEVIGRGRPLVRPALPFVAIPTTAGTGAEVTRNAVLASTQHRLKISVRSPFLLPRLAVVDPDLTLELPAALTASTGLDALTQLIEPMVSCRANPLVDGFCRDGLARVAVSLRRAYSSPSDRIAREGMAWASVLGGLSLANAGLGAVHGFAAPIGGRFPAPHGAVCAALLPVVMEVNLRALRQRQPENPALERYREVARLLTGRAEASADDGVVWVRELCADLGIAPLRVYGIGSGDVQELCAKAAQASSMKANPLALERGELEEILTRAM